MKKSPSILIDIMSHFSASNNTIAAMMTSLNQCIFHLRQAHTMHYYYVTQCTKTNTPYRYSLLMLIQMMWMLMKTLNLEAPHPNKPHPPQDKQAPLRYLLKQPQQLLLLLLHQVKSLLNV